MKAEHIVERATGPAIAADSDNRILAWNAAARQLFGYSDSWGPVVGKRLHEVVAITDVFGNPYRSDGQPFWELATSGAPVNNFELKVPQPEGPNLPVSVSAVVVLGPGELEYAVVYLLRPIHRRRRADEAIDRILSMSLDELRTINGSSESRREDHRLTRREIEVLRLLAHGNSKEEIAHTLNVSVNTVRSHVQHLLSKLEAHSKLEAVTKAFELRLL